MTDRAWQLERDGFTVLPGVLTGEEVWTARRQVTEVLDRRGIVKHGGTVLPNAAVEAPELAWLFGHPAVLARVKEATAVDHLVFTLEADLHRNYPASNWHKDSGEGVMPGGYFGCDAWDDPACRVYKVALYLQDHPAGSGLWIRPGSTGSADPDRGEAVPVALESGDAALFDVRISHRGVRPPLVDRVIARGGDAVGGPAARAAARLRRLRLGLAGPGDRLAVYFALGAPNDRTETFARRNMRRQLDQLGRQPAPVPASLRQTLDAAGVTTVDLGR